MKIFQLIAMIICIIAALVSGIARDLPLVIVNVGLLLFNAIMYATTDD